MVGVAPSEYVVVETADEVVLLDDNVVDEVEVVTKLDDDEL